MSDVRPFEPDLQDLQNGGSGLGPLARLLLWLGALSLIFVIFVIWVPINPWFPAATNQAREVDSLFKFMLAASGVIFIYVQGLVLAFALRYRRRASDPESALGPAIHGHTRLELAWSAGPALLLIVLVVLSLRVWSDEHPTLPRQLRLDVRAFQYGYSFSMPQYGVTNVANVTLPLHEPILVTETASDVIHSFWVPQFRVQMDAVPGIVTNEQLTPNQKGTFPVICTQYCGTGHSTMQGISKVTVANESDFVNWLRHNGATRLPGGTTTAALLQP